MSDDFDFEWLLDQVLFSKKFKPIPIKYSSFHKILGIMGINNKLNELLVLVSVDNFGMPDGFYYNFFDEHFSPDIAFYVLCKDDYFFEAKELFELGDVNPRCPKEALKLAIYNGNLEMVKWLYGLFKADSILLSKYFRICACKKELAIMKWLLSVSSKNRRNELLRDLKYIGYKDVVSLIKNNM